MAGGGRRFTRGLDLEFGGGPLFEGEYWYTIEVKQRGRCRMGTPIKSQVTKRSFALAGRKTSVSLEDPFWSALKEIAAVEDQTLSTLIGEIDGSGHEGNLASAIRVFVLAHFRRSTAH
jgi:predicted DNA-binding ribbon-helix-helix protein